MWLYLFIGLLVIGALIFVFMPSTVFTKKRDYDTLGPLDLQKTPTVAKTDATQLMLLESNTGTLQLFVYPLPYQRTGTLSICSGDTSGIAQPGDANCATARYGLCVCNGTDCTNCSHKGFVNIVNVSNVVRLEILAVPDAGRRDAAASQLTIRCKRPLPNGTGAQVVEETFALPELPYQKWSMITIAREGRRFDIFFDNKLVISKRTQHVVDSSLATGQIIAGDPMLHGHVGYVKVYSHKMTLSEVEKMYSMQADTNGQPYLPQPTRDFTSIFSLCKDGSCFAGPSFRPSSPLVDWASQYD
jgi:hypothetical protein